MAHPVLRDIRDIANMVLFKDDQIKPQKNVIYRGAWPPLSKNNKNNYHYDETEYNELKSVNTDLYDSTQHLETGRVFSQPEQTPHSHEAKRLEDALK